MFDSDDTAPVWFADHFLKDKFEDIWKKKQLNVNYYNFAVLSLSSQLAKTGLSSGSFDCAMCKKPMNKQTKPVECAQCENKLHRTCFKKVKNAPKVPQAGWVCHDGSGSIMVKEAFPPQRLSQRKRPRIDYGLDQTGVYEVNDDIPVLPTVSPVNTSPPASTFLPVSSACSSASPVTLYPSLASVDEFSQHSLNPAASSFTPPPSLANMVYTSPPFPVASVPLSSTISSTLPISSSRPVSFEGLSPPMSAVPSSVPLPATAPKKPRQRQSTIPTTSEGFLSESHKIERDAAKLRLKEEEVKNKDLTETNKILSDRIKLFEDKRVKDAYDSIQPNVKFPPNKQTPEIPSLQSQPSNHSISGFPSQTTDPIVQI